MDKVPHKWQAEIRLGLQEALVNAVKHGNCLDPRKIILVRYKTSGSQYWWVIKDQGSGFDFENCDCGDCVETADHSASVGDCGRGLFILNQVFDEVQWTRGGRELHLRKRMPRWFNMPLVC
ncbi:MAG: ATP-binding protein [Cyanobacteria bacterium P01_C01_bin.120]